MTVAAAVAVVAPAGWEGKHGTYVGAGDESHRRETIAAVAAAAVACHHRETIAAAAGAAATCHRREISIVSAVAAVACHRRGTSVVAAAAAAACHRREKSYRRPFDGLRLPRPPCSHNHGRRQEHVGLGVPPAYPPPALVSQFHGPCVESRRNGWCSLVAGG